MRNLILGLLLGLAVSIVADEFTTITKTFSHVETDKKFTANAGQLIELTFKVGGVTLIDKTKTVPNGKMIEGSVSFYATVK